MFVLLQLDVSPFLLASPDSDGIETNLRAANPEEKLVWALP
jgi:hypothetical protein